MSAIITSNGIEYIRYFWVFTEEDQRTVDTHWWPEHIRHSLINTKMYLASLPGAGIPGWGSDFADQVAQGTVRPTGLAHDPRVPVCDAEPSEHIVALFSRLTSGGQGQGQDPSHVMDEKSTADLWHPWEIEEIMKEEHRQAGIERAWDAADAMYSRMNPSWGDGT